MKVKFTYEDYRHMPDDKRYELIEGELVMVPSPITMHQRISRKLEFILAEFVQKNNLGEVFYAPFDVVFSDEDVLQPDIIFISNGRSSIVTQDNVQGAPDLVVEITSPTTLYRDREIKRKVYAKYGVGEYWLVDTDKQTIEVMVLGEKGFKTVAVCRRGEMLQSPLLIGFSFDTSEIF